jgi:polysaccharide biosynthesis protein PslG
MKRVVALLISCFAIVGLGVRSIVASNGSKVGVTYGISDPALARESPPEQAADLTAMKSVGITSLRIDANWASVQSQGPTAYRWYKLDEEVRVILNARMTVDLVIGGCPEWAASSYKNGDLFSQPASARRYAAFASQVAKRYTPAGVHIFEIWNEPNNASFWQPHPNAAAYTADLVAAYGAIKSVDASAIVVSGGLAPGPTYGNGTNINPVTFLREMYADGAKGKFDAVGFHPYSFPATPYTYKGWSGWSQMILTKPSIRSVMSSHNDGSKPIWATEFGAPTAGVNNVGLSGQSESLFQAIEFTRNVSWLRALYIYTWRDTIPAHGDSYEFGLIAGNGSPKPALSRVGLLLRR